MAYKPKEVRDATLHKHCRECDEVLLIPVNKEDYFAWQDKVLIQEAMPYLDADTRELLISGICGLCFDKLWEGKE